LAVVGGGLTLFGERLGVRDEVEVAKALLALAGELDGLHRGDLVVAHGVLSIYERVMMREVNLAMEEISGVGEGLGDVGEQVRHGLVHAGPVRAVVNPFAILGEHG
jgi:hypothetical protein